MTRTSADVALGPETALPWRMVTEVPPFGVRLDKLKLDALSLDVATFARKHAPAFFLRLGENAPAPRKPMRTISQPHDITGENVMYALYIRRRSTSEMPFISIGRLDGNDITITDESISKFHAFVRETPGLPLTLQDARSKNGTTVDGMRVAPRGEGAPTILTPGQTVRFGVVHCSFLDAASLVTLLRRTALEHVAR